MNLLTTTTLMMLTFSCGLKIKDSGVGPVTTIDPLEAYHQRPLVTTQLETVRITRKKQVVVRYDCNDHVTSNGLETINSLAKKMTINYENRKNAWSYDVYNRTTRDGKKGAFVSEGKFVIDYSPTVFNMKVNEGFNQVEYVFKKCPNIGKDPYGNKICLGEPVTEKEGIFEIQILYNVDIIPGELIVKPTPEQCRPSSNGADA